MKKAQCEEIVKRPERGEIVNNQDVTVRRHGLTVVRLTVVRLTVVRLTVVRLRLDGYSGPN